MGQTQPPCLRCRDALSGTRASGWTSCRMVCWATSARLRARDPIRLSSSPTLPIAGMTPFKPCTRSSHGKDRGMEEVSCSSMAHISHIL